ncbi:MAG: DUF58 domain-containing protein [Gemmatimonadaceae bacterium]|nr:DUF58 domain-containing protein [Gemmatimonadaceae bacterium]
MTTPHPPTSTDRDAGMPGAQFIDPAILGRIGDLELVARWVVEGFISGLHRSPHLGFSTDFAQHRAYMPGDDIRRIDWRVYARTERYYLKTFEADTNTNFTVLLDTSASMGFRHERLTKLEYAKFLGACLTYFSHRQRDRVGLVTFDEAVREIVPPSARHLSHVLHALDRAEARGKGGLTAPLQRVAENQTRRGIFLLLSDLYEAPEVVVKALAPLRDGGHDVIVFHILDSAERTLPYTDATTFRDVETGMRVPVIPGKLREEYLEAIGSHVARMAKVLGENQVDYALVDTSQPLDRMLFEYLVKRERMRTVR